MQDLIFENDDRLHVNTQTRGKSGYVHMAGPASKYHLALPLIQCRPHDTNRSFNAIPQHKMHFHLARSGEDRKELEERVLLAT